MKVYSMVDGDVEGQQVNDEDDNKDVENGEVTSFGLFHGSGGRRRDFTEEDGGISRRKATAKRQTTKGTTANMRRKRVGSLLNRVVVE